MIRVIEVEWEDTCGRHMWGREAVPGPSRNVSVGYELEGKKGMVRISEAWDITNGSFGCTTAIPRSAVRRVRVLRKGKRLREG